MEKVPGSDSMTVRATIDGSPEKLLVGIGTIRTQLWHNTALKLDPTVGIESSAACLGITLGSMEAGGFPVQVNPTSAFAPSAFDGVLGADMMPRYDIDLDFAHRKLNYFSPEQCKGAGIYSESKHADFGAGDKIGARN